MSITDIENAIKKHEQKDFEAHQKIIETNKEQQKKLDEMYVKVVEMHKVFTSAKWMQKFVISFFGAIGIVAGAFIALRELFWND